MSTFFVDRQSTYPNRCLITPQNGTPYYAVVERADEPIVAGTPLNAETLNGLVSDITSQFHAESKESPGCYYRMVDGEMEWINPPMYDGLEYRTTERCGGYPVYTKKLSMDLPDLDQTRSREIMRSETDVLLLDINGSIRDDLFGWFHTYPFVTKSGDPQVDVKVKIVIPTQGLTILQLDVTSLNVNVAGGTAMFTFKYVKY